MIPCPRLRVIRICLPRYGCRACGTIHQAPAPERPIAKRRSALSCLKRSTLQAEPDLRRHSVESRRFDHGELGRRRMLVAGPLQMRLAEHVFALQKLFADNTPIPVLDPGRGRTKTGRLWVYPRTTGPGAGPIHRAAVYLHRPDRRAERLPPIWRSSRALFRSTAILRALSDGGDIRLAACWAHARRKFYEVQQATTSPIALRRIAELYAIETPIRGQTASVRQACDKRVRCRWSPMEAWFKRQLIHIPPRSGLADATHYVLNRWEQFLLLLDDGRIELDNTNTVERAIRPITLCRKNQLSAGSDGSAARWATVSSLITHRKAQRRRAGRLLRDVLERMSNGYPISRLDDLPPWMRPSNTAA